MIPTASEARSGVVLDDSVNAAITRGIAAAKAMGREWCALSVPNAIAEMKAAQLAALGYSVVMGPGPEGAQQAIIAWASGKTVAEVLAAHAEAEAAEKVAYEAASAPERAANAAAKSAKVERIARLREAMADTDGKRARAQAKGMKP